MPRDVVNLLGLVSDVTEARDSNCVLLDNSFDAFIPFVQKAMTSIQEIFKSKQENRPGNIYSPFHKHQTNSSLNSQEKREDGKGSFLFKENVIKQV